MQVDPAFGCPAPQAGVIVEIVAAHVGVTHLLPAGHAKSIGPGYPGRVEVDPTFGCPGPQAGVFCAAYVGVTYLLIFGLNIAVAGIEVDIGDLSYFCLSCPADQITLGT